MGNRRDGFASISGPASSPLDPLRFKAWRRCAVAGAACLFLLAALGLPLPATASAAVSSADAGDAHSCAVHSSGELACWGDDSAGQLDGVPTGEFLSVSAGGSHSCAVRSSGEPACWGDDSAGQLDGVPAGEFLSVSAGGSHSCAIRADGSLACWGDDTAGQVSGAESAFRLHKHNNDKHHPHHKDDSPKFIAVSAGGSHSCAVAADGDLVCWGDNSAGQRDGSPEGQFVAVAAGGSHSCAIRADGELACWGDDSAGQLDGIPAGQFASLSAGGSHSCAIRANGEPACWGDNGHGQVQPRLTNTEPPRAVIGEPYEHRFETTPQAPPAEFLLTGGALPGGLGLDSDGGLSGTATEPGDYAFSIAAKNGITPDDEEEVSLDVVGTPVPEIGSATGVTIDSATLGGSVNPANLAAEAWFEYWPAGATPASAVRTPTQAVPKGLTPLDVSAAIAGLSPDTEYTFRLAAANELSPDPVHSETLSLKTAPAPVQFVPPPKVDLGLPPPVVGQSVNVEPEKGVVRTKCPSDDGFTKLVSAEQIPISCLIDTRRGTVDLTAATADAGTQSSFFWGGVFGVGQKAAKKWATELKLAGPRRCERRKSKGASTSRRKGRGRKLWGSGKGRFRTNGNYGSASVRGTTWLVADRCDNSTLFAVREGVVRVRDFVKRKSIVLRAGKRYIARAAIARLR
ncbi:MAG TPA: putative Ig domain-containing protein [Solirubrobacterales bacterium]